MSGHGSNDDWINTDVPPGDPRRRTKLVKARNGGQWEATRGSWGKPPNQDYNQRGNHYDRYDYAAERSGEDWQYQEVRGKGGKQGGYGKWRNWD